MKVVIVLLLIVVVVVIVIPVVVDIRIDARRLLVNEFIIII